MNAMTYALVPLAQATIERLLDRRAEPGQSLDEIVTALLDELDSRRSAPAEINRAPAPAANRNVAPRSTSRRHSSGRGLIYQMFGTAYYANDANEALLAILRHMAAREPQFCQTLARKVEGRSRNHIARTPEAVYPGRPDLRKYIIELVPGWFIGTNIANREKLVILRHACHVAGLTPGKDLQIELPTAGPLL
jgi:hypothetical protein